MYTHTHTHTQVSKAYSAKQGRAVLSIRRESTTLNHQQKNKVEEPEADQGSAGNKLSTVCHSRADVPEQLKGTMDQGVIYLYDQVKVEHSGVGIVFVILQPYLACHQNQQNQSSAHGVAAEEELEIRVLSVDRDGPADQGKALKGDHLVSVDGHMVKGKSWEEVRKLVEGPIGTNVNLSFERCGLRNPPRNSNLGTTLQAVTSTGLHIHIHIHIHIHVCVCVCVCTYSVCVCVCVCV